MIANVFFLGYAYGSGPVPMNKKVKIEHPPALRSNADSGWADDPVVKQLTEQLTKQLGIKVALQSVIVTREYGHHGEDQSAQEAQTNTGGLSAGTQGPEATQD